MELALFISFTATLHPTRLSCPESSCLYDLSPFTTKGLSPSSSCTVCMVQPLPHSPARVCPAARAHFSPQPPASPLLSMAFPFCPATPPGMFSQPCSTKLWGFLNHYSSQRGGSNHQVRTGTSAGAWYHVVHVLHCSCICLSTPRCICTCLGDEHFPMLL